MAGGTIYGTTSNEYIDVKVEWGEIPSPSKNISQVWANLYYKRNNTGYTTTGTGTFKILLSTPYATDGGVASGTSITKTLTITGDKWVLAHNTTVLVDHADDGTGYTVITASGSIPGTTLEQTNLSERVELETFPKATAIDSLSCATNYFTGTLTYKYTPKTATVYNRCNISLNLDGTYHAVKSIDLGQKAKSQQTATVTLSSTELSTVYNLLPNSTSGKLRFTFRTYSDSGYSTQVGDAGYKEISLTIPNDTTTQPTMTMTLAPVNDSSSLGSLYAKGLSKVKATFSSGAGKYGASIASYIMTVAGKDYGSPYTSGYLAATGSIEVKGTIKDSRGYSRSYSQNITVLDYTAPSLDSLACSSTFFNGTITHKYTPPNNTFYTRCAVTIGSTTVKNETHTRASGQQEVSFTFTASELETIYKALPNSTSGKLKFTFQAFTDSGYSKQIGADSAKEITLSIPNIDATQPTATLTLSPVTSLASPFNTLYIKGKTKVTATLASGSGKYGASIKSYRVTIGSQSGTSPLTSAFLSSAGDLTVTGTVTDSRDISRTYTQKITVIDYSAPRLLPASGQSSIIAERCNSSGTLDENGTYLKIAVKRSYSTVSGKNKCKIQYRYKIEGGSFNSWTEILGRTATSDEVVTNALLGGALAATSTYVVQIMAIDDIGDSTTTTITISSQKVYMHRAGSRNSFGIGKYVEESNTVDIAEDFTVKVRGQLLVGDEVTGASLDDDIPSRPVKISDTGWISLGIIDTNASVMASSNDVGRGTNGAGCYYRVINGSHVYVAFNCACTYAGSALTINKDKIPTEYCPARNAYAMVPTGGRAIVRAIANHSGNVVIDYVQSLTATANTTSANVSWIDGYIDYWI